MTIWGYEVICRASSALLSVLKFRFLEVTSTCAKLCRKAGGGLEQIQLLLGHASIQTTERSLGTEQALAHA
jgi:integrase